MPQQTDLIGSGWTFPLAIDARGGIALTEQPDEIEQSIRIILETPRGHRLLRPEFGSRLHELVFAPINAATFATARHYVDDALGYWEPRIAVSDVLVTPHPDLNGCLLITILFEIKATHDERALVYPFYTIPDEE